MIRFAAGSSSWQNRQGVAAVTGPVRRGTRRIGAGRFGVHSQAHPSAQPYTLCSSAGCSQSTAAPHPASAASAGAGSLQLAHRAPARRGWGSVGVGPHVGHCIRPGAGAASGVQVTACGSIVM